MVRLHQHGHGPRVPAQRRVHGDRALADRARPVAGGRGGPALGEDEVEEAVDHVVLVRHVVVEGHRLEAEAFAELSHRQRADPALVHELERGSEDPVSVEGNARLGH